MRTCLLMLVLVLVVAPCKGQQTTTGEAKTTGPCSPANTGNNNQFTINCQGLSPEQGQKILGILNKILANQLDPKAVMEKLDEILKVVNPNLPAKTYFCNGQWKATGPGAHAAFEISMGGDDSKFQEMVRLNNGHQYAELLKMSLTQIQSAPEWLTPRLFSALAYEGMGKILKAREMLNEYDSRIGPSYDVEPCRQISTYLHNTIR